MKPVILAVASASLAFSALSHAAKPVTISFQESIEGENGVRHDQYMVKCSDGKQRELTAWNKRRKWCIGDASSENCQKKQIKAAKAACKLSD